MATAQRIFARYQHAGCLPMRPLKTFIIYARKDESFKNDLLLHLRGSLIETGHLDVWQDGEILPGEDWEKKIEQQLEAAEIFLVLLSIHSLTSEFIRKKELLKALEKKSRIVPILVRSCFWQNNPVFAGLQGLPKNMKPVASFSDPDDAWTEVMGALHDMVEAIRTEAKLAALKDEEASPRQKSTNQENGPTEPNPGVQSVGGDVEYYRTEAQKLQNLKILGGANLEQKNMGAVEKGNASRDKDVGRGKGTEQKEPSQKEIEDQIRKTMRRMGAGASRKRQKIRRDKRELMDERAELGLADMVLVKGGTFTMGSPENEEGRYDNETQHEVTLSDFLIGKYLVTQNLWQEIMGDNPSHFIGDDLPVEQVSRDDIQIFLKKLNKLYPEKNFRLPTEAEWEYAARGEPLSKGFLYAGSDDLEEVGWYAGNSDSKTHPVGQKIPNELGLFDMSGNVWEWCADWFGDYSKEISFGIINPENGTYRVIRGGSWYSLLRGCRIACRGYWLPGGKHNYLGFRLAASPQ